MDDTSYCFFFFTSMQYLNLKRKQAILSFLTAKKAAILASAWLAVASVVHVRSYDTSHVMAWQFGWEYKQLWQLSFTTCLEYNRFGKLLNHWV